MSCFRAVAATSSSSYYSPSGRAGGRRPWRWWRAKCAGIAAAVGSRLRRSIRGLDGHRRRRRRAPLSSSSFSSAQRGWHQHHHRQRRTSFAPVYVDDLYNYTYDHDHHQPANKALSLHAVVVPEGPPAPSAAANGGDRKLMSAPARAAAGAARRAAAATATTTTAAATGARAGSGGKQQQARAAAVAGVGAMRNVLLMSPGRGGGVLGVVKGMGEVDLRAELFIRRFKEDMRLQSQRSAEEFQAMLARGL